MPLSFRTTFTYRPYSIGGGGPPPRFTSTGIARGNRIRLTSRANGEPPRYIRLGEIERKYREREREGGIPPYDYPRKTGHGTTFLEFFSSLKFEARGEGEIVDSKQSFRAPIPIPSPCSFSQLERDIKRAFLRVSRKVFFFPYNIIRSFGIFFSKILKSFFDPNLSS